MNKIVLLTIIVIVVAAGFIFWPKKAKGPAAVGSGVVETQDKSGSGSDNQTNTEKKVSNLQFPGVLESSKINNKKAVIVTDKGTIEFELFADKAPKSVSNFVYLAENKFFDGLTFHRVEPDFVIQGGDPVGNGTGGPGYEFPDEPVVGDYVAGSVAMANSGADTNGSQFFICLENQPDLPKSYNLFGQVTVGMDVVKNISVSDKMTAVTIADK